MTLDDMWSPEEVRRITPHAIREYLTRRGWVRKPSPRSGFEYYEHPDMVFDNGNPIGMFAPPNTKYDDYPLRVLDFIRRMFQLYGTRPPAVYAELTAPVPAAAAGGA